MISLSLLECNEKESLEQIRWRSGRECLTVCVCAPCPPPQLTLVTMGTHQAAGPEVLDTPRHF